MAYIFIITFMPKLVSNLRKNFLYIAWHQKLTVDSHGFHGLFLRPSPSRRALHVFQSLFQDENQCVKLLSRVKTNTCLVPLWCTSWDGPSLAYLALVAAYMGDACSSDSCQFFVNLMLSQLIILYNIHLVQNFL